MEGLMGVLPDQIQPQPQQQQQQQQQQPAKVVERLNPAVQQQLNLESIKTRAISLFKAITRILDDFDLMSRSGALPKWQDALGQFSMVNLELYNIVEDVKKVSKAFVVHPRNVTAENATILPVMLSSKLLPEMEVDDNSKREQLLLGMQHLPVPAQIDKLKARIDMIAAACESAEKIIAETRKTYGLDTRHRSITVPTLDKTFADKILQQERLLRDAVNNGKGLQPEQRHPTGPLPPHLADVLPVSDGMQTYGDGSGMYSKSTPPMSSSSLSNQATPLQASAGGQLGRSVPSPSPSTATATSSFDNTAASPLPYVNSPRSGGTNMMMNAPSPQQQQTLQQQQHQLQQQRNKFMQLAPQQQQQLLAQQQFRQSSLQGLGQQNQLSQLHDMQTQTSQKLQSLQGQSPMQFSQPLGTQQFQGRQLPTGVGGHMQHAIGQSQLSQASQLNRHMGQFSGPANTALFNAAQGAPNAPMISNMSAAMASQPLIPRMQFALPGGNPQRPHASPMLTETMFNMGANPAASMMSLPQQQQVPQGAFGNMAPQNSQNLQSTMVPLQNNPQNLQNFQQRQQNPQ